MIKYEYNNPKTCYFLVAKTGDKKPLFYASYKTKGDRNVRRAKMFYTKDEAVKTASEINAKRSRNKYKLETADRYIGSVSWRLELDHDYASKKYSLRVYNLLRTIRDVERAYKSKIYKKVPSMTDIKAVEDRIKKYIDDKTNQIKDINNEINNLTVILNNELPTIDLNKLSQECTTDREIMLKKLYGVGSNE